MRFWKRLGIIGLIGAFIAFVIYIGVAYYTGVFPDPDWTGFGPPKVNADGQEIAHFKTLWDWLGLLLVPLVLAVGGFFLTQFENREARKVEEERIKEARKFEGVRITEARKVEEERIKEARKFEERRAQEAVLEAYLDQMTALLLHESLRTSHRDDEVRSVARARTLTALRVLDGVRPATVLQFLYEAQLLGGVGSKKDDGTTVTSRAIVSVREANLQFANLRYLSLPFADLAGVDLRFADLRNTDLQYVNLRFADLRNADLTGADLRGADLTGAVLVECKVTPEQLAQAASLKGATLPFDITAPPALEAETPGPQDETERQPSAAPADTNEVKLPQNTAQ